jgi:hypothetical protein
MSKFLVNGEQVQVDVIAAPEGYSGVQRIDGCNFEGGLELLGPIVAFRIDTTVINVDGFDKLETVCTPVLLDNTGVEKNTLVACPGGQVIDIGDTTYSGIDDYIHSLNKPHQTDSPP